VLMRKPPLLYLILYQITTSQFFQQHERLRYYIVLEEILQYLKQDPHFREYTDLDYIPVLKVLS